MAPSPPTDMDLAGIVDLHIHSAPDIRPRYADDVEMAQAAAAAGIRAVVLKSHVTLTADRAQIAAKAVWGSVKVFGGLALNRAVGGPNPAAVEVALQLGAREIWMPTVDAAGQPGAGTGKDGLSIISAEGTLRGEVLATLDLIRQADVILGTGHLPVRETVVLVREARKLGLRKIVVTHPESPSVRMPLDVQREIAGEGLYFERCYLNALPVSGDGLAAVVHAIREVGTASTVLATDFGQAENPSPVEGMRAYLSRLMAAGFDNAELRLMAAETPALLLAI